VRHHRDELVFYPVGALGIGARQPLGVKQPVVLRHRVPAFDFNSSSLCHVTEHEHHADDAAIATPDRCATVVDWALCAIRGDQYRVIGEAHHGPFPQHSNDRVVSRPDRRSVPRIDRRRR
jgi:hypothetical protein